MRRGLALGNRCPDVLAVERLVGRVWVGVCQRKRGGHNVHHVQRLVDNTLLEFGGPIEDGRHAHAAFIQTALAAAQVAVACR